MSLSNGRKYLAIPGPSVMPDRVLQAMQQPAPNIYGGALQTLTESVVPDLKAVARTKGKVAMYASNGHGAWEAALVNVVAPGEMVLGLTTGKFGYGWLETAESIGAQTEVLEFGTRAPIDPDTLETRLRADKAHEIKVILTTHVDTSTSIRSDIAAVRAAVDAASHPALLLVDCIASLGCDVFEMDAWGVDVMVAGSQKGLMTPPGMSFVFISEKAEAARAKLTRVPKYWDWIERANPTEFYQYFGGTSPTHHMFALREALTMLVHEEGIEAAWARHATLACAVRAAVEAWGDGGTLRLNVPNPDWYSNAVTSVSMQSPDGTALRDWLIENMGLTLGIGLGMAAPGDPAWHGHFRIGHMGHLNGHMVMGLLGAIEVAMQALGIEHGPGALNAAAKVMAQA